MQRKEVTKTHSIQAQKIWFPLSMDMQLMISMNGNNCTSYTHEHDRANTT